MRESAKSFRALSECSSGNSVFRPTLASRTSFTGLAKEGNADVLDSVFGNQSLPKLGGPLVDPTCDLGINGTAGKEGL